MASVQRGVFDNDSRLFPPWFHTMLLPTLYGRLPFIYSVDFTPLLN